MKLKIRKIGNSLGASIPKEILEKLMVKEGDSLYVTETAEGILLSPYDPEFAEVMEVAKDVSSRYKNALKKLAE
ncbi:MAG: AbrB/MazE/SpoVT family DNA-binding domain-containing protein [Xenococcus sp. (in: cyanobacteria)]